MEKIVNTIIKNKIPVYLVSPHLDDAALSAGGLMLSLKGKTRVTVVNVFSTGGTKSTFSAKVALKHAGHTDPKVYYRSRRIEDKKALSNFGVEIINLNFVDALWREKKNPDMLARFIGSFFPEVTHKYPTYRFHINKATVKEEKELVEEVALRLSETITEKAYIFCPVGVGGHIDHLVVNAAVKKLSNKRIYWSDYPYNYNTEKKRQSYYKVLRSSKYIDEKIAILPTYKTQFRSMFVDGKAPIMDEIYYAQK